MPVTNEESEGADDDADRDHGRITQRRGRNCAVNGAVICSSVTALGGGSLARA